MRPRPRWAGSLGLIGVLVTLAVSSPVMAAQDEDVYSGLPIGLPEFPRRVRLNLPELKPEHQIRLGILRLHPSFRSAIEYDDNITLASSDEKGDVLFTEKPALVGEMKLGNHRLVAGYGMELVTFAKEQEENTTNHLAEGLLELNFNDLHLTVTETMENSVGRLFSETAARDHVLLNAVQILGRYDRPRWALESGWTHNTVDHRTDIFKVDSYGEDVLSVLGGYKMLPKTLALLETDLGMVNFDHNTRRADQWYWQLLTGVRGELTPKVTATLKIGFQGRQLSDVGGQGPQNDFDGVVADFEVHYAPKVSDVVRVDYVRAVRPSTFADNQWYREDKISLSYRKRVARKWIITPIYSWQSNAYPEEATVAGNTARRKDYFNQVGAELRYEMREWASMGAAYNFRSRNSNLDAEDYLDNRFSVDVTVAF